MPTMKQQQAEEWLCKLIGYRFNAPKAIKEFDGELFYTFEDGEVKGIDYRTPQEIEEARIEAEEDAAESAEYEQQKESDRLLKRTPRRQNASASSSCRLRIRPTKTSDLSIWVWTFTTDQFKVSRNHSNRTNTAAKLRLSSQHCGLCLRTATGWP